MHRVYHGLNADFSRLLGGESRGGARPRTGTLRRARGRAPRGEEGLRRRSSTRAASSTRRGVPFEAVIVGPDDDAGRGLRARIAERGLDERVRARGPDEPGRAVRRSTAARPPSACPAGCSTTATATASRTCSPRRWPRGTPVVTTPISGIPEIVARRRQRPARRARRPGAPSPTRCAPARRPRARRRASPTRPRDGPRRASTASGSPGTLAAAVPRGDGVTVTALADGSGVAPRPVFCVDRRTRTATAAVADARAAGASRTRAHARPRAGAGLARRGAARRRGVADRVDEVLLRPRPRARVQRDRRRRASSTRGSGSWRSFLRQVPAGHDTERRRRPPGAELALRVGRVRRRPRFPGLAPASRELLASIGPQAAHVATTSRRSATTARSSSTRCCSSRSPSRSSTATACCWRSRWPSCTRTCSPTSAPDGVHREHSTHYHLHRAALVPRRARERPPLRPRRFPRGYDERLARRATSRCTATARTARSRRSSDSDTRRLRRAARARRRPARPPDLRWAATAGAAGARPRGALRQLPHRRLPRPAQRLGRPRPRTPTSASCIFDCGPLGDGGHGHYDLLSIEVAAGGRPLVMDPGRYTYAEAASRTCATGSRAPRRTTRSCVDGLDQTPYRRGQAAKGPIAGGRLVARHSAPGLDIARRRGASPCYDAVHTPPRRLRRRRVLARRGPPARRTRTATTCASTSRRTPRAG